MGSEMCIRDRNNLRDVEEDRASGKRTLAVRFGTTFLWQLTRIFILAAFLLGFAGFQYDAHWLPAFSLPWIVVGIWSTEGVRRTPPGVHFNRYLAGAALQLVLFAGAFAAAVAI